jgi:2-polyprenyl-3-methyl-5-hydroxy-6-metoxy-1,4-benzoquinol methylase
MDQKSLYELQIYRQLDYKEKIVKIATSELSSKNNFIISAIKSHHNINQQQLNIVELSIGDGDLTLDILRFLPEINLTCVDISSSRIESVKYLIEQIISKDLVELTNYKIPNVNFVECNFDTEFNVLPSNEFNVVIAIDIMEHVVDVFGFIENCHRILKHEGMLLIRVPNIAYIRHRIGLLFGHLPITASWFGRQGDLSNWRNQWGWDGGHLHYFTLPILYKLLSEAGFHVEKCQDPGTRFTNIRNISPEWLYSNPFFTAKKL